MILRQSLTHASRATSFQVLMKRWSAIHPYNVVTLIELEGPAELARWKQAAEEVLAETGLARADFETKSSKILYSPAEASVPTRWIEPGFSLERWVADEMNRPFAEERFFPLRLGVSAGPSGVRLAFTYDHWPMDDGLAGRLFGMILCRGLGLRGPAPPCIETNARLSRAKEAAWRRWPAHLISRAKSLWKLRESYSPLVGCRDDLAVDVVLPSMETDWLASVVQAARRRNVTVHDLLLTSLGGALDDVLEERRERKRHRLALSSVVNLRPHVAGLQRAMGVYLGSFDVFYPERPEDAETALRVIHEQTRQAKESHAYWAGLAEMAYANMVGRFQSSAAHTRHLMNNHPVAAGVSNLRLDDEVLGKELEERIRSWIAVVPTGMLTPMAVGLRTVNGKGGLSLTYRTACYSRERAEQVSEGLVRRLSAW